MTYVFDLDQTLCHKDGLKYDEATPIPERIAWVNMLYDLGHTIIIETARGSGTGIPMYDLTKAQLERWGLKHHQLRTNTKFHADFYVDDKGVNADEFFACAS